MASNTVYNTSSMLHVLLSRKPKEDAAGFDELNLLVKEFERRVWAKGLQDMVEKNPHRGLLGALDEDTEVLTYVLAGRTMTTIQKGGVSVTVLSAEKEKPSRMGLHGICATIDQAKDLLLFACAIWEKDGIQMVHSPAVTLDVLAGTA